MIDFVSQAWPWYISGPMIALVMFFLLWAGGRFGVSSSLETLCSIAGAGKRIQLFDVDWKKNIWNVVFAIGALIGGYLSVTLLANDAPLDLSQNTIQDLDALGIAFDGGIAPSSIFNWANLLTARGFFLMMVGGFLVGFGTRWAGGCTSGHAISGLSNFQLPSLIAVIGFFIGGLISTFLVFPLIF